MKSLATPDFWKAYAKLPPKIRKEADKAYIIWQENPSHPSLHFKKVQANLWSARITLNYRALVLKKGNDHSVFRMHNAKGEAMPAVHASHLAYCYVGLQPVNCTSAK